MDNLNDWIQVIKGRIVGKLITKEEMEEQRRVIELLYQENELEEEALYLNQYLCKT